MRAELVVPACPVDATHLGWKDCQTAKRPQFPEFGLLYLSGPNRRAPRRQHREAWPNRAPVLECLCRFEDRFGMSFDFNLRPDFPNDAR